MGTVYSSYLTPSDTKPDFRTPEKYDPLYGFPEGRKERVAQMSQEEMAAMRLDPEHRDYCAHYLKDFFQCRNDNWPFVVKCEHQKHDWDKCQYDDFVLRMKEYERERRLNERAKRKRSKEMKEELGE